MCVSLKANIQSYVIMNWKILSQPLGISDASGGYAPRKKPWILSAALAAGSLASSLFGASSSRKAAEEARREQEAQKAAKEAERLRNKHQSWLDTKSGQNTMRVLQDQAQKFVNQQRGAQAVGGGTDAAVAIEKEQQNQKQADVIAQAEANHEQQVNANDAQYRQEIDRINSNIQQTKMAQAEATSQVAGAVSDALMKGAVMAAGPKLTGGNNGGQPEKATGSPAGGGVSPSVEPVKINDPAILEHQGSSAPQSQPFSMRDYSRNLASRLFGDYKNYRTAATIRY